MFVEREITTNTTCLVAVSLWITAVLLWGIGWAADERYVAVLSILVCGAAITATVRTYFISLAEQMRTALLVTGRDRRRDEVRPIR